MLSEVDNPISLIIITLLAMSAFFSASETALFSLSRVYLKKLENNSGKASRLILRLLRKPRQLLITILLGNTFVNIAISSFASLYALFLADDYGFSNSSVILVQVILTTLLILFFGEIIPKLVALATADLLSRVLCYPLILVSFTLYPFAWLLEKFSLIISRKKSSDHHLGVHFTQEEFHNLIQSESSSRGLEEHEKKMLVGLFRFKDAEIKEIYVPRVKITAIDETKSLEDLKAVIVDSGYSRIPVFRESIDDIVGIVYVKDLVLYPDKKSIKDFIRPVWFVTENMKVQTLLNQFKQKKLQVAVVVDEYGGTSGIISLEDILEEIVGDIRDEYDNDETPELVQKDQHTYILSGTYSIRQFNQEFQTDIPVEEYDIIAEYLLAHFNHVPEIGETLAIDERITLTILAGDEKSIKQIQLSLSQGD